MAGQEPRIDGLGQAEAAEERLKWDFYDLDFSVHKCIRYHEKLCAFYGVWRDWIKIVSVVAGSSLFFLLLAQAHVFSEIFAGFVALWAILDYIIKPDKKAELHCELRDRFHDLAAAMKRATHTEANYKEFAAQRIEIEKREPPCKRLVDLQARNEECRARNFPPDDLVPLSRAQRILGYFATFGMRRLEEWKAARHRQVHA